jgi:hypothetical protein
VAAFSRSGVFVLNKATEELTTALEESESEKETETGLKGKSGKHTCSGSEFDTIGPIQKILDIGGWIFSLVCRKNISTSLPGCAPLYLLYHSWKLDCVQ